MLRVSRDQASQNEMEGFAFPPCEAWRQREMTGKPQFDQQKQDHSRQQSQGGNLGQKDARQEKKKQSELSRMGEMSREKQEEPKR